MDLNSINANINRLLTNIWAVISFLKEFAVDSAKDVTITYINADGTESVKTFPNIEKWRDMVKPENYRVSTSTASFAYSTTPLPVTSLINTDNPLFSVTDNKTIVFKRSGVYMVTVDMLTRSTDIVTFSTRLEFSDDKRYVIPHTTIDAGWVRALIKKEQRYLVGESFSLNYFNGSYGTWNDNLVSNITITRLGD